MFAVIFEVLPKPGAWDEYLALAAELRPELERIDGFIENLRYHSQRRPGWLLSLSFWRDEKALVRWRSHAWHHSVQARARAAVFDDYHLRVGEVAATDGVAEVRRRFDETEAGAGRAVSIIEAPETTEQPAAAGLVGWDAFDGITVPDSRLMLLSWQHASPGFADVPKGGRRREVSVIRDYGMRDRREAPQHFPAVR